jgi:hypothetical protein
MVRLAAVAVWLVLSTSPLYAQETLFTITFPSANIHAAPTTASRVIGTTARGKSFEVTRELGSWVAVAWHEAQNGVGYLHVSWGTLSRGGVVEAERTSSAPLAIARPIPELTAGRQRAPVLEPVSAPTARRIDRQPSQLTVQPSRVLLPSHVLGVGGRMGTQALAGFAGMGRLWFAGPVGAQLELGRATHTSAALLRMHVTDVGFNAITSFSDLVTNTVWMRPYVGGGVSVFRSTVRSAAGVSLATDSSRGYQAFGGAEFTWANVPQLAVSADVRHVWAETAFSGFETGGLGLALAAHWYVK